MLHIGLFIEEVGVMPRHRGTDDPSWERARDPGDVKPGFLLGIFQDVIN